jgi:hypothetical protein
MKIDSWIKLVLAIVIAMICLKILGFAFSILGALLHIALNVVIVGGIVLLILMWFGKKSAI